MEVPFRHVGIRRMGIVLVTLAGALLASCGGGGGDGSGDPQTTSLQMGGSIQGVPLDLSGTVSTLAGATDLALDGHGAEAVFLRPTGVANDGTYLYVADSGNRRIRRVEIATGEVTTFAGSGPGTPDSPDGTGTTASFSYPHYITSEGPYLYVTDGGYSTVRRIEIATGDVTTLAGSGTLGSADGKGSAASFDSPSGITSDGIYLYVADTYNHKIRRIEIDSGEVTTFAGSGTQGSVDGAGTAASFAYPQDITNDGSYLYVADAINHKIRRIDIASGEVTTLAGSGSWGSADAIGTAASFAYPQGITSDGAYLYVTEGSGHRVRRIAIVTGDVTTLAGSGIRGSADGNGTAASFAGPTGITTDGAYLYLADSRNQKIRQIEIASGTVTSVAGTGMRDGTGTLARFQGPSKVTTDGINLYVADTYNNAIRRIAIDTGEVTTLAGSGTRGSADGEGTTASFAYPVGVTTDGIYLYVADTGNATIRRIAIDSSEVTTFAGSGFWGAADGSATAATFGGPSGITTDGFYLYVADSINHKIRRVDIDSGEVTTLAGSGTEGSTDGKGTAASFFYPQGITTDGVYLFVADTFNDTIRRIAIDSGEVTTLAGSGSPGLTDGTGTSASFTNPQDITTDGTYLYVADTSNLTIRRVEINSGIVTTLAGSGRLGSTDGTGAAASFRYPGGITTDGKNLYFTDTYTGSVRRIQ